MCMFLVAPPDLLYQSHVWLVFSCLFTVPKAYFVEEQTDFMFALHLKSAGSKRLTNRVFSIKVQKHINNLLF